MLFLDTVRQIDAVGTVPNECRESHVDFSIANSYVGRRLLFAIPINLIQYKINSNALLVSLLVSLIFIMVFINS